jgi:hypothetical protein
VELRGGAETLKVRDLQIAIIAQNSIRISQPYNLQAYTTKAALTGGKITWNEQLTMWVKGLPKP